MENTNTTERITQKMERKKFFIYSGAAAIGLLALSKFPFNLFNFNKSDREIKSGSIKITQNPDAVSRKPKEYNREYKNG